MAMNKQQLIQFVEGKLTNSEKLKEVFNWMEKDRKNKRYLIYLKNVQSLTAEKEGKLNIAEEFELVKQKINFNIRRISPKRVVFRYAAVFLAVIGLTWAIHFSVNTTKKEIWNKIYCPYGQLMKVTLSDATVIWLNSGSTISYPNVFNRSQRIVILKGEAFFKVKSNKQHPFIVNVDRVKVRVTGTEFDIDAYPNSYSLKTTLVRGKVDICNAKGDWGLRLHPGQMAIYDKKTQCLTTSDVDVSMCSLWREGKIIFQNTRIEEIAEKLSYWYNVKIIVSDEYTKNLKISFTALKNRPLDDVLSSMQFLYKQVSYKKINENKMQEIIITGTKN